MTKTQKTLEKALIEAGGIVKHAFNRPKRIEHKGSVRSGEDVNLVTETDRKTERVIIEIIRGAFPDHSILAEESEPSGSSHKKWIIDPVDGTTNFAHSFPLACISIAYEEEGVIKLGGVFNPMQNELFWAERGKGALLNGKKIHATKTKTLQSSLVVTGFPYDRKKRADYYLNFYKEFMMRTHGVRRLGSAALDLCFVACGRFDGYWEFSLHPWDVAAGYLIANEAGCTLTDFTGKPMNIYEKQLLATNGLIHKEMLDLIQKNL